MTVLYRNANRRRGGLCVMARPTCGVLGADIPSTGGNGAALAYASLSLPADAAKGYAIWIDEHGFPDGVLPPNDDTSLAAPYALPQGVYSARSTLIENDVDLAPAFTAQITAGTPPAPDPLFRNANERRPGLLNGAPAPSLNVMQGPKTGVLGELIAQTGEPSAAWMQPSVLSLLEAGKQFSFWLTATDIQSANLPPTDFGAITTTNLPSGSTYTSTIGVYRWGVPIASMTTSFSSADLSGSVAYAEPAGDTGAFAVQAGPDHTAAATYVEPGGDQFTATVLVGQMPVITAEFMYVEPGADVGAFVVDVSIKPPTFMSVAYVEPGGDTASEAVVRVGGVVEMAMAYAEPAGDIAFARFEVPQVSEPGMLARLAAEFEEMRRPYGLYVESRTVLECAINATRQYVGWTDLCDPTAHNGLFSISGSTRVRPGEWALISPLFRLYVERETALVLEATRASGVEMVGRMTSEIVASIEQYERELGRLAFYEDVWTVGICEEEVEPCEPLPRAKPKRLC